MWTPNDPENKAGFRPRGLPLPGSLLQLFSLHRYRGAAVIAALLLPVGMQGQSASGPSAASASYAKLPLTFEANQGQSDPHVKFLARGRGYSLFLTGQSAVLALHKGDTSGAKQNLLNDRRLSQAAAKPVKTDVVRMELLGSAQNAEIAGVEQLPGRANYFIGNDPANWHADVPTYAKVRYTGVYPGVDLVYYGNQRQLEYDFVIGAGADPNPVRLHFAGARKIRLNADGDLEVIGTNGEIAFRKPEIYQVKDGKRRSVEGTFRLMPGNRVGFIVGDYDRGRELVIDPTLVYSTYLGGSGSLYATLPIYAGDVGLAIAVDGQGNAYVTGKAWSGDFPVTAKAFQKGRGGLYNAFVTKINPAGTEILYSTYLGGSGVFTGGASAPDVGGDSGNSIAVDASGNAYVTGGTYSVNFPVTPRAFQKINKGTINLATEGIPYGDNAFITKLNPTGSALLYSTYLGGTGVQNNTNLSDGDQGTGIAIDTSGIAYVTGQTFSTDFPVTANAVQSVNHGAGSLAANAFVTAIDPTGSSLIYSTYLGGSGVPISCSCNSIESAAGIAIDAAGDAYVTGFSYSTDFPVTSGAFQTTNRAANNQGSNAFVTELNPTGSGLIYSTYLGGSSGDGASAIALDTSNNAYITGSAGSADFPITKGAFHSANTGAFVTKLNPQGSGLAFSIILGGAYTTGVAVDVSGSAYVTGLTGATNFPVTSNALQKVNNAAANQTYNAFLTKFNTTGSALLYSSYFGGSGRVGGPFSPYITQGDYAHSITLDAVGNAYIVGEVYSTDLPVSTNAFQMINNGTDNYVSNAFVARFAITTPILSTATSLSSSNNPAKIPKTVTFTADVTAESVAGIPTGTVGFAIDGGAPTYVTIDASGQASYSTPSLAAGQHTIVAAYSGDLHYSASSTSLTQTMVGAPAKVAALSGSGQVTTYGSWFADPLILLVTDANGLPVFDTPVTFSGNGLVFLHQLAATDSDGTVAMNVKATVANTTLTADATVNGLPPVAFSEYATDALLKVTPKNVSVPYGQAIPALTYTITGFVNGNGSNVVTGAPTEYTEAVKGSPIGTYPILLSQGTLAAPNYGFDLLQGTLTITSDGTAVKPLFSPPGNTYLPGQMITITDPTPGAVIYYTTDGSTPTTKSPIYIGPITLNASQTISALAVAVGYTNSEIQSERYWIK